MMGLSISTYAQSQESIAFFNLKKKDGLPSNNVQSIAKDKLGFLWIATNDGLCRYDGPNTIKIFRKPEEDDPKTNSLESNSITKLLCDEQGIMWIGTRFGGLTSFNPSNNEWNTYRHVPADETSLSNDEVLSVFQDSKHRLWIGTERGLNLFDPERKSFERITLRDEIKNIEPKAILTIYEDLKGWIWVGTWSGGFHLLMTNSDGSIVKDDSKRFLDTLDRKTSNVWCIFHDSQERYWVGTHGGGLVLMDLPDNASNVINSPEWEPVYHRYSAMSEEAPNVRSNAFQTILEDKEGNIWLGTTYGLYRFKKKSLEQFDYHKKSALQLDRFTSSSYESDHISGNNIIELLEDDQGMIWAATSSGLSQYNKYTNQFQNFALYEITDGLPHATNLVVDKKDNIWIAGTSEGLFKYKLYADKLVLEKENFKSKILGKQVLSIHSPDNEQLYIGTNLGVTHINLNNKKSVTYPIVGKNGLNESLFISSILVDDHKFIWVGTKIGLIKINPKTKEFKLYEHLTNKSNSLSDNPVNYIMQDKFGHVWIATYKGLNRVKNPHEENLEFENFLFNNEKAQLGPVSNQIMCLKEMGDYLYVGTVTGICRYNFKTEEYETFETMKQKHWIRSIELGLNNTLWLSTNGGLLHVNADITSIRSFDTNDGIISNSFLLGSSCTDNDNNLYFGSFKGLTRFQPNDLKTNLVPPPVYITEVEKMTPDGITYEDGIHKTEIELEHDTYRFSVNFAALNYNRAKKNKFEYKLDGFEENWNNGKSGTPIVYTNLKPDEYKLKVRASNNDGIWNEEGASLTIIQKAPYWKTWWFRLLALATILFLIYWYTNSIRQRNEELSTYNKNLSEEIANRKRIEQTLNDNNAELKRSNKDLEQFAYISSHDLKEPLRSIANFSSLLSRKHKDKLDDEAGLYIDFIQSGTKRMGEIIESLLTYSTVGNKDSVYSKVDLNTLVKDKIQDLSHLISEKNATVEVQNLPTINCHKEQLGMVFFNLINNAIKFNTQEQPQILVKSNGKIGGHWNFSVKDNGIGIDKKHHDQVFDVFNRLHGKKEYEGTGIGLAVCQKIVLRHQGEIWFKSQPGQGTKFFFTIKDNLVNETT